MSKYYCQLACIRGTPYRGSDLNADMLLNDFYTLVMKDFELNKGLRNPNARKDHYLVWELESEKELNNFISYLKTDFARFCLSVYKNANTSGYGEMSLVPWLDFKESWDDAKLYKKFNINKETQDYITEFLPDYHGIRQ